MPEYLATVTWPDSVHDFFDLLTQFSGIKEMTTDHIRFVIRADDGYDLAITVREFADELAEGQHEGAEITGRPIRIDDDSLPGASLSDDEPPKGG